VNNTPWGERYCYVLRSGMRAGGAVEATSRKAMHVSPFHPMDLDYRWRLSRPDERLSVRMTLHRADATNAPDVPQPPVFDAAMSLHRVPISAGALARVLVGFPLMTVQVVAAIHWQALRLWLKRVPVHDHPARRAVAAAPVPASSVLPPERSR